VVIQLEKEPPNCRQMTTRHPLSFKRGPQSAGEDYCQQRHDTKELTQNTTLPATHRQVLKEKSLQAKLSQKFNGFMLIHS